MSFSRLFAQTTLFTTNDAARYLNKYGHLLKWKNYKENVIEVGCADGAITKDILYPFLEDRVDKLEAIDKLAPMIEYAKKYNYSKNIDYKTNDILDKKYIESKSGKVDHIFSFYAAHWIPDTRSLLQSLHKMLKPGGQFFMTTLYDTPAHRSFKKLLKEEKWLRYLPKEEPLTSYGENPIEYMHDLLKDVNFEIDLLTSKKMSADVTGFEDLMRSLAHMYEHLSQLPENLQEQLIQDLIQNSCENNLYMGEPSRYQMLYEGLIVVASKKAI